MSNACAIQINNSIAIKALSQQERAGLQLKVTPCKRHLLRNKVALGKREREREKWWWLVLLQLP